MSSWIVCEECSAEFPLSEDTYKERPLENVNEVTQVGLECPACHAWTRQYIESPRLKEIRASLRRYRAAVQKSPSFRNQKALQRAQKRFQKEYMRVQEEWGKRLKPDA